MRLVPTRVGSLLVLVSLLIACSQPAGAPVQTAPDQNSAPAPAPSTATSAEKTQVKLGLISPLSGGAARIGLSARNAAQLRIDEANQDASLKYHYELVTLDDECKPSNGVQQVLKMSSDPQVVGVLGHYCSVVNLATADTYHKTGLSMIAWASILPGVTYAHDYKEIFRITGTMITENQVGADFVDKNLGFKKYAILYDTTDFGRGEAELFKQYYDPKGVQIVAEQAFNPDAQDLTTELTTIKAANPEVIYVGSLAPQAARIRSQMTRLGMNMPLQVSSGATNAEYTSTLDPEIAEGTFSFLPGGQPEDMPGGPKFMADYEAAGFKEEADVTSPIAYAAADLYIRAVEAVGPDRLKVIDWLIASGTDPKKLDTIMGQVMFDDHRQNLLAPVTPYVVQDGEFIPWNRSEYASEDRKVPGAK